MNENYYIVEMNTALEGLLELLDDCGFDYDFDALYPVPEGYTEIHVWYYPGESRIVEDIFAPYV